MRKKGSLGGTVRGTARGTVRGPVRRMVLTGAIGLLTTVVAGCGLRLDRDPKMPELSSADILRDAVARTIAATTPDSGLAAAFETFAEAVGPPWDPPPGLDEPVKAPNPDPGPLTSTQSLTDIARQVVEASPALGTETAPIVAVLADVAVGALLHLDDIDSGAAGTIRDALADKVRSTVEGTFGEEPTTDQSTAPSDSAEHPLSAVIVASYIGVYTYERASVHLSDEHPARQEAHGRIGRLQGAIAHASGLIGAGAIPSDRPAWDLAARPADRDTALESIRLAEDGLVAAMASAQGVIPPQLFLSWLDDSGRARRRADGAQDLRFGVVPRSEEEQN